MQHSAGWCARPQPARENLGGSSALSIPPPARKQSPGKQQAAPWEALLEESVEEPRMGAQAGCEAGKGKGIDAGPRSCRKPGGWEKPERNLEGKECVWKAGSARELRIRSLSAQLVPRARTWLSDGGWGRGRGALKVEE